MSAKLLNWAFFCKFHVVRQKIMSFVKKLIVGNQNSINIVTAKKEITTLLNYLRLINYYDED